MTARSLATGALGVLLAVSLVGCTGPEDPGGRASDPATSAHSPTDPLSSAPTSPASTVPPADGEEIRADLFTLRVPRRFADVDRTHAISIPADDFSTGESIYVGNLPDMLDKPLSDLARDAATESQWDGRPRQLATVTIAGQEWYHLAGRDVLTEHADEFGTWREGHVVTVRFNLDGSRPARQRTIAATLATFAWR